jgi:hypothetical protein
MAGKTEILRALEGLPKDALIEVKEFITSLKKCRGKRRAADRNEDTLAKKQLSVIKKWAGTRLEAGFSGRDHDTVLYRNDSRGSRRASLAH